MPSVGLPVAVWPLSAKTPSVVYKEILTDNVVLRLRKLPT